MAVTTTKTNKPINPRGNDQSPKGYNRAALYSGKALDFDGVNDRVNITTDSFDLYSVSFYYIGAIGTAANGTAFSSGTTNVNDGVTLGAFTGTLTNETIAIGKDGNYTATSETFADGVHFICASWDATNSKYKIYINGQEVDTFNNGTDAGLNTGITAPALGYRKLLSDQYFEGGLSNVRAFSTALTAAQVADLYNNPEKVVPTGVDNTALKLWLPMMEGAGTTAYDGSGNGNHGTISGATWTHGIGAPVSQTAVIDWNKGTNYQTYSEEFTIAWALYGVSISTDQTTAPDGLNTADLYDDGTGTGTHLVEKTCANLSSAVGISGFLYAKYIDTQYLVLGTYDTGYHFAVYDIQNGTLGSKMGGVTSSIEAAGNGFYKCSFTYSANTRIDPYLSFSLRDDDTANYFGGTGTNRQAYIWGASLRPTTDGDAYVKTGATPQTSPVLLPQGLTSGRDITGVNLFENVRKQGALNLDGNSWAEVHDNASLDITDAITLEAWVYWDDASAKGVLGRWHIDASSRNYLLYKLSATNISFYINSNNLINQGGLTATKGWTHIVGTYNRTNAVLYIDGVQQATAAHTNAISTGTLPVEIGRNFTTANQALTAPIAQPRIYNRALTAEEVQRNYDAGKNIYTNS